MIRGIKKCLQGDTSDIPEDAAPEVSGDIPGEASGSDRNGGDDDGEFGMDQSLIDERLGLGDHLAAHLVQFIVLIDNIHGYDMNLLSRR